MFFWLDYSSESNVCFCFFCQIIHQRVMYVYVFYQIIHQRVMYVLGFLSNNSSESNVCFCFFVK